MSVTFHNTNTQKSAYGQYADNTYKTRQKGGASFAQAVEESVKTNRYRPEVDFDEEAFQMVGPNAPQSVKEAWMEAAKEVRANGLGIRGNGMMSHISQMMVQRVTRMFRGEDVDSVGILGTTKESAIRATKQALYDLEHPIAYTPKSIEVQQAIAKEKEFYEAFLNKLEWKQQTGTGSFGNTAGNAAVWKRGYTVYMKTDDMLYSGGNGTGLSFYLKYAENSTEENPIVIAKGVDENGNEFEQTINIKDINPSHATVVEMRALEAHYKVDKGGGLSSFPPMSGGYGEMGLNDRADFISMFDKAIKDMKLLGRFDLVSFYIKNMNTYMDLVRK